ncbi:MAG TPA: hypothetical protein VGD59_05635 [Acidisarcina sp.]
MGKRRVQRTMQQSGLRALGRRRFSRAQHGQQPCFAHRTGPARATSGWLRRIPSGLAT